MRRPAILEWPGRVRGPQLHGNNAPPATLAPGAEVDPAHQFTWSIPSCAWRHSLGDTPLTDQENQSPLNTKTRTKKGLPLGGIGAGNFMYNVSGSFGPWMMKPARYEERFLSQAAFHIREEVEGREAKVRTLATDDVMPAWKPLNVGDGDYYALLPRGWVTYKVFETEVALQFFSPVIKDNYRETSLPAAL